MKPPRENEDGGKYGNGIIVRSYGKGQVCTHVLQSSEGSKERTDPIGCCSRADGIIVRSYSKSVVFTHALKG